MAKVLLIISMLSIYAACSAASNICENETAGTRIAHPLDCSKFIVCGQKDAPAQILSCPDDLDFNRRLQMCDLKWRAGCVLWSLPSNNVYDSNNAATQALKPPHRVISAASSSIAATGPSGTVCEQQGKCADLPDGTLLKDNSSNGYIVCQCGCEIPRPCPNNLVFNEELQVCDWATNDSPASPPNPTQSTSAPAETTKPSSTTALPPPSTTSYPGSTAPHITTKAPVTTTLSPPAVVTTTSTTTPTTTVAPSPSSTPTLPPPAESPTTPKAPVEPTTVAPSPTNGPATGPSGTSCEQKGKCAGQLDGTKFSDDASNGYIVCQCECEILRPCPQSLVFNETLGVCDWPAGQPAITCPDGLVFNATANACDWPADNSSGNGNNGNSIQCPDNLVYNATANACDWPAGTDGGQNVVCNNDVDICQNQAQGTLFAVNGVCNMFYKCNYGCAVEIACPNNLIYDSENQYCDYPQNVKCDWPYTPPSGPTAGPSGIACASNGRCLGRNEGTMLASTTSCNKYVACQCDCEVELDCPIGLYFDPVLNVCNYPNEVNCTI